MHWWLLLLANPAQKFHMMQLNGLTMAVNKRKFKHSIVKKNIAANADADTFLNESSNGLVTYEI